MLRAGTGDEGLTDYRSPSLFQKVSVALFFLSFAGDYRSENTGGDSTQTIYLAVCLASFVLCFLAFRKGRQRVGHLIPILLGSLLVLSSFAGAMMQGVPLDTLLKLELRYGLMLGSMFVVYWWVDRGFSPAHIVNLLMAAALINILFNVGYSFGVRGVTIENARYSISPISAVIVFGLALLPAFRLRPLAVAAIALAGAAIYFSATRTYLLSIVAIVGSFAVILSWFRSLRYLLALASLVGLSVLVVFVSLETGDELWASRFSSNPNIADPTWLSRLAEYTEQMRLLTQDGFTLIVGRGLGAPYNWDAVTVSDLVSLGQFQRSALFERTEFGHSFWVYSLYSQGILAGWILPFILISALLVSYRNVLFNRRFLVRESHAISVQTTLALTGYFIATFFSHQFGDRLFCILFGGLVALSFVVAGEARLAAHTNKRPAGARIYLPHHA